MNTDRVMDQVLRRPGRSRHPDLRLGLLLPPIPGQDQDQVIENSAPKIVAGLGGNIHCLDPTAGARGARLEGLARGQDMARQGLEVHLEQEPEVKDRVGGRP
jgi:hypothetical protein